MTEEREHPAISLARIQRLQREAEEQKAKVGAQMDALYRCFQSPEWADARQLLELMLESYRNELEADLPPLTAAAVKGSIAVLRRILSIARGDKDPLLGAAVSLMKDKGKL